MGEKRYGSFIVLNGQEHWISGTQAEIAEQLLKLGWKLSRNVTKERLVEWQPIETAPKDGTEVLLWVPDGTYFALMMTGSYEGCAMGWCDNVRGSPGFEPTHWMPLPRPPSDKGET
jgi:hypothetical protein